MHNFHTLLHPLNSSNKTQLVLKMVMGASSLDLDEIRKAQRADGPAGILGIGTANPANHVIQAEYPDYYFRITNSEHMTDLKEKFKRMCKHIYSYFISFETYIIYIFS